MCQFGNIPIWKFDNVPIWKCGSEAMRRECKKGLTFLLSIIILFLYKPISVRDTTRVGRSLFFFRSLLSISFLVVIL
jgi:hypothetical protein